MTPRVYAASAVLLVALVVLLSGCGGLGDGSGTSGFDENLAIATAREEMRCVETESISYCPADVAAPGGSSEVSTDVPEDGRVTCAETNDADGCAIQVAVEPDGFEEGVSFRIAIRLLTPDPRPWILSGEFDPGDDASGQLTVEATFLRTDPPDPPFFIQVAVLAFVGFPDDVPEAVEDLGRSGAFEAFLLVDLFVTPAGEVVDVTDPPGVSEAAIGHGWR